MQLHFLNGESEKKRMGGTIHFCYCIFSVFCSLGGISISTKTAIEREVSS